ncbi:MAG: HK97 family phage prohead protease [Pseudomonadota bacterium]
MTLNRKFADATNVIAAEDGTFSGYASVFNLPDLGDEMVAPGAFSQSLRTKGVERIRMLFQHDPDQPIGHWTDIREDQYGLAVKGVIDTNVERGREVLSLLRTGSLDGLSIGFKTVEARPDAATGTRLITKADLWEISVVTFPMLPQARVSDVKSARALPTTRTFERWLVREAGFSRSQARTIITKGYQGLNTARDAGGRAHLNEPQNTPLLRAIRRATDMVQPQH